MRITTRTTNPTKKDIANIRKSKLNQNPSKASYILSHRFEKDLRNQVKVNRIRKTNDLLGKIAESVGNSSKQKNTLKNLFGEKTIMRNGRKQTINKFSTQSQYKRVKNAYKQVQKGTFNLKRRVAKSTKYKEIKKHLPDDTSTNELLDFLDRTTFYFENRNTIIRHNNGDQKASRKLKRAYDINETEKQVSILENM